MGNTLSVETDKYNIRRLYTLSLLLVMPTFLDFSKALLGESSSFSMLVYVILGCYAYIFAVKQIRPKDFIPIIIFSTVVLISYILNGNTDYYTDKSFLITSVIFYPIGALVIYKIDNWKPFFDIFSPFAKFGIILGAIVILKGRVSLGYKEVFNYMEFSYAMLPLVLEVYVMMRKKFNIINLLFFIVGFGAILSFGARATILFSLAFILYYELIYNSRNATLFMLSVVIFTVIYINIENIMQALASFSIFSDSRFITLYLKGSLVESSSRDIIYETCLSRINNMGIEVEGFFGNRAYMGSAVYPHNFFYEIMMDFGWIFGPVIILWIANLVMKDYFIKGYHLMTVYALLSLFARYTISGSYIIEGKFWIFLFILLSINHRCKPVKYRYKYV